MASRLTIRLLPALQYCRNLALGRAVGWRHSVRSLSSSNIILAGDVNAGRLLAVAQREISLVEKSVQELPAVTGFSAVVTGALATLTSDCGLTKVELDCNNVVEFESEESSDDEDEPGLVYNYPALTVTASNQQGLSLLFELSFDGYGDYEFPWQRLQLDSVSVSNKSDSLSMLSLESGHMSAEVYEALFEFIKARGINESFAKDILNFYEVLEQRCYVNDFLGGITRFCEDS